MPKIQKGVVYLDELEEEFVKCGVLPDDYHEYESHPKKYRDMIARDRSAMFSRAFISFKTQLRHMELECVGERATRFKTRIALGFEPRKEYTQEKVRDDYMSYEKRFANRAKIILTSSTSNEDDAKELDDYQSNLVKLVGNKGRELRAKYSKKQVQ
jgi:hypothetical protein